jgi:hypothetical protein
VHCAGDAVAHRLQIEKAMNAPYDREALRQQQHEATKEEFEEFLGLRPRKHWRVTFLLTRVAWPVRHPVGITPVPADRVPRLLWCATLVAKWK